jgi:hypothetical protein
MVHSACTARPGNGEAISSINAPVTYEGFVHGPNALIGVQVQDLETGEWITLNKTSSAVKPAHTDPCGASWHHWTVQVPLPRRLDLRFWRPAWGIGFPFGAVNFFIVTRAVFLPTQQRLRSFEYEFEGCPPFVLGTTCGGDFAAACGDTSGEIVLTCTATPDGTGTCQQ